MNERPDELRAMPYEQYLKTPAWANKREQALERDGHRCRVCNTSEHLHVHHRTYTRRGNEDLNDLTTLCETCHESFHKRVKQEHLMAMTYTTPVARKSKEEIEQQWEDYLIGMLLLNPGLCLHVCGILSESDFAGDDTRAIYQLLNSVHPRTDPPQSTEQEIPPALIPTITRCQNAVASDMPTKQAAQVKEVVQTAVQIKRRHLLRLNNDLSFRIRDADAAGADRETLRALQVQQLEVSQQLRTLTIAMHLHG
jgi:hypothetical protein